MTFHRRAVPTYAGGIPATHDYINNVVGPDTPAPVSARQAGGTYNDTYYEVPGETAESTKVNRANDALAENCDFLDDILQASHPAPTFQGFTAGGGGDAQIALSDDTFVGRSGVPVDQEVRDSLIQLVHESTLAPIISATDIPIYVNDIRDSGDSGNVIGTEGSGFHTGPIAVFSETIPAATNYRLLHMVRSTVGIEQDPSDASGGMGYLAQLVVESAKRPQASTMPFVPGGSNWADASSLAALLLQGAVDEIVDTLGDNAAGVAGALHVGAEVYAGTSITLSIGSVESQLQQLADGLGGLAAGNNWAGDNTYNAGAEVNFNSDIVSMSPALLELSGTTIEVTANLLMDGAGLIWNVGDATGPRVVQGRRGGTGANAGANVSISAQPGQNQTGSTNNNEGGWVEVEVGGPGSGGSLEEGQPGAWDLNFPDSSGVNKYGVRHRCVQDLTVTGVSSSDTVEYPMSDGDVYFVDIVGIIDENAGTAYRTIQFIGLIKRFSGTTTMSPSGGSQTGAHSAGDALAEALFTVSTSANGFTVGITNGGSGWTTVLTAHITIRRVAGW